MFLQTTAGKYIIGIVIGILVIVGIWEFASFYARKAEATKFDKKQTELLKKSQESDALADKYKAQSDSNEFYAKKLEDEIKLDRKNASLNQKIYEEAYKNEKQEIDNKYETDKSFIASDLTVCQRCRDLCERSSKLTNYGPEFASAACNADTECADACSGP